MGYEFPLFYTTRLDGVEALKAPFTILAGLLGERIKMQLAKKRFRQKRLEQQ
jgi:hypothetical protein